MVFNSLTRSSLLEDRFAIKKPALAATTMNDRTGSVCLVPALDPRRQGLGESA